MMTFVGDQLPWLGPFLAWAAGLSIVPLTPILPAHLANGSRRRVPNPRQTTKAGNYSKKFEKYFYTVENHAITTALHETIATPDSAITSRLRAGSRFLV